MSNSPYLRHRRYLHRNGVGGPSPLNTIHVIECLVEDYGWDAVMDVLMEMAESDEGFEELQEFLDAAITVNEDKGQLFVL